MLTTLIYDRELAQIRAAALPNFERFKTAKAVRSDWRKARLRAGGHLPRQRTRNSA